MGSVDLLMTLLGGEVLSSRELGGRLRVSQATTSRLLGTAGERVLRIGRGRATRYTAAREVFDVGRSVPVFAVDEAGRVRQLAVLRGSGAAGYVVEATTGAAEFWLLGEGGHGVFDGLPYFIHDLRPAGFLGRQLARRLAVEWGYPADPRSWTDEHIGRFLVRLGDDVPGNLVVGEAAARRLQRRAASPVEDREREYPRLALEVLGAGPPGSSAAGEQPKFAVHHADVGHVIVKFSPATASADARRWCDLLRAEHLAQVLIAERGLPAARTAIYALSRRVFLESQRFDRHGAHGRSAALSLSMVDAEFAGRGHGWTQVAQTLYDGGLLDQPSLAQVTWLEAFGEWIGNTDMHLGNLSLAPTPDGFRVLPVYDMLPMAFAPVHGEQPEVQLPPPIRTVANEEAWASAGNAAADYWRRLADAPQISARFRALAKDLGRRTRGFLGG